jgi:RNA polymerase subunit RPABC4/transcription elongation factor Spt4
MEDLDKIIDRISELEKQTQAEKKPPAKKKKTEVDEDVCPICGGDLLLVEEGIVFCPACSKYFEEEEG